MLKRFVIYGLAGWCIEVFFTGIYSLFTGDAMLTSSTYIWMFFVYGLAIVLEPVHNKIRGMPIVIRGGVYAVLILLIEYSTGLFLLKLIGECPWDYGSGRYTINGITRIDYAPIWGMVGLLFEKLHDGLTLPKTSKQPDEG